MRRMVAVLLVLLAAGLAATAGVRLRYLGSFEPPREGWEFQGVPVGGISGLTLAPDGVFYAISDDKGKHVNPPGVIYELAIDLDGTGIKDVRVVGIVRLKTPDGAPYGYGDIDGEDVLWTPEGFIVSSERDREGRPWIRRFSFSGEFLEELPIPEVFQPAFQGDSQVRGTRNNLAFEATSITPDYRRFYAMNEEALVQDGPLATPELGTPVRLVVYDLGDGPEVTGEYVYLTEPVFAAPPEGKFGDNGVAGMVYVGHIIPELDLIVMERSYVSGAGNHIGLFGVKINDAQNVMAIESLADPGQKEPIVVLDKVPLLIISDDPSLTQVDFDPDNMEAITIGPRLRNGHYTLIIASDDNFNPKYQRNVFALFEIVPDGK